MRPTGGGHWALSIAASLAVFIVLATANTAGYRYGASDEAFYIPAVLRHLDPALFPRDAVLIDSQARLTVVDEALAALARATGASLPHLFLPLYLLTLTLLAGAVLRLTRRLGFEPWATVGVLAAFTLRHAIARTGANTLEAYFHPRQLTFALGLWALALFLESRLAWCAALLALGAVIHPTTTLWFIVWIGVAVAWQHPRWRRPAVYGFIPAAAVAWVMLWRGPLAGHLVRMDGAWLAVIAAKDYLFPLDWPATVWLTNVIAIPIVLLGWRARAKAGALVDGETGLVIGAMALAVVFVAWLPFNAARIAIAVQLQVSRIFWMLDALATIYLVWMASHLRVGLRPTSPRRPALVASIIVIASVARGGYTMLVEFPDRPLFAVDIAHADWREAMAWARTTDPRSGWLADPVHAARYGISLRAAAGRDVLIESLKDTAIAMYDRSIAMRVADRERALDAHPWNTEKGARALAAMYDLDYLVTDTPLHLPLAHRAGALFIYRIR